VAVVVALLTLVPLVYLAVRAVEGGTDTLGPLLGARTLELTLWTLGLGLAVTVGAVGLGVPIAWLTALTDLPARRLWAALVVAPLAMPSYLLAFSFAGAFAPRGWVAGLLSPMAAIKPPSVHGFAGATVVLTLVTLPFVVLSVRAALLRLDPATLEAARSLGRGPWGAARTAVLPVILPAVGAGALLACLYAISDFGAVSILRFDTLATAIYSQYRFSFDRSAAAFLAILLLLLALVLVWAETRLRRRGALSVPHGRGREPRPVRLGAWRWPALALCTTLTALSLGLPSVTIASWLLGGLGRDLRLSDTLEALRGSLVLGVTAASLAVATALPLAVLIVRYPGRPATYSDRLLYAVYAIPGISLALAIASFTLNVVPTVYQTLFVLIAAVTMRYLVQSVGALRGPLLQLSPRTLEAARSLGERPLGVLRTITLPLLRPGLVAGLALVLLSALKELPLTLLLGPAGFRTLATELWDSARDAFYSQAAAPAALLLIVSFLSVGLLLRRGEVSP
jgi:iron(III) transport system permease protein